MKKSILATLAFAFTFAFAGLAQAGIINGSFENGMTGWTPNNGMSSVVSTYTASDGFASVVMSPTDGSKFAILQANTPGTKITSSPFAVSAGDVLSVDWFFDAKDFFPFNDSASFAVKVVAGSITLVNNMLADVWSAGPFGLEGWNTASYIMPVSGIVDLIFTSKNGLDNGFDSVAGFDNIKLTHVPEPGSLALLLAGGLAAFGFTRRKQQQTS